MSKYLKGSLKYRLVLPEEEQQSKIEKIDLDIEAVSFLSKKNGISAKKQLMIAGIMRARDIDFSNPDPENVRVQLSVQFARNKKASRIPGLTIQQWFCELAEKAPAKLTKENYVHKAIRYNIIVQNDKRFRFNEESVEGVTSITELVEYFSHKDNANRYAELVDLVDSRDTDGSISKEDDQ